MDKTLHKIFARRIAETRILRGFSQSDLARLMEVSPAFVCNYERGETNATFSTVAKFAKALQIEPKNLLK